MSISEVIGGFIGSVITSTVSDVVSDAIPMVKTVGVYGIAIAAIPAGYSVGQAVYDSSMKTQLEDHLWLKRRMEVGDAMYIADKVRDCAAGSVFAVSFVPLAYLVYRDYC